MLSDRSIKYKYLNPNLLFLATAPSTSSSDDSDSLSSEVVVSLVDTVTGRMLHRQAHAGARGPVSAVVSENLVLYFYWDIDAARCAWYRGQDDVHMRKGRRRLHAG